MDGDCKQALLNFPQKIAMLGKATVLVSELNDCVRAVQLGGRVETVAGQGGSGWRDGDLALMNFPYGMCLTDDCTLALTESDNHSIRLLHL